MVLIIAFLRMYGNNEKPVFFTASHRTRTRSRRRGGEAGDPGRGAAHHIADRAEVSLRRALDNELIMHRADDETVAGRMGGRLSIPLPSGTAVPAPLREGSQGTRKGVKNRPAAAESLTDENLPRPHYPFCPPGIFPKGEDF